MLPHDYRKDDSIGVRHDTLVDALMDLDHVKHQLEEIYVAADDIADEGHIWTDDERREIRMVQETTEELLKATKENLDDTQRELEAVRDRM